MTDPPRHTCRGRSMVCQGPCNPLRAPQHHHHHHHHRHRHHRQKNDATSVATSRKNISFLPDEFTPLLLKSLKSDTPVTSEISRDDESISRTSSFARIALIKVAKTPRPEETTDIPAILRKVLSQKKLDKLGEASTSESPPLRKIDTTVPMRRIVPIRTIPSPPRETVARTAAYRAPRILENAKFIITKKLNRLTSKTMSPFSLFLIIFIIYAGIHVLLAVITWRTSVYQYFASSQICGILVFLMWRITGTILI
ncbi:uncharacterized protein [Polyergus mexicanus]|uniref:uncharacterized protein n=1 Tax=Polyergus mexicanus TaxID=615972 RepID=UPI0038B5AC67